MVGSEGTLGIITKAVFRLRPLPTTQVLMLVPFRKIEEACEAVSAIFMAGICPSCLEFMERNALDFAIAYIGSGIYVPEDIEAHLLIELDGFDADQLVKEAETVFLVLEKFDIGEVLFGDSDKQKEELWMLRRKAPYAVKSNSIYKEEDTVVPRNALTALVRKIRELEKKYGFKAVCYGHAGDGNLHVNILKSGLSDDVWNGVLPEAITELFQTVVKLGGTISGEHGIGLVQKPYLHIAISDAHMNLMRGIKRTFDPHNILNPGKIFDL
jgi:glycolate oxidase